jgi:uncharacterized membrane protein
MGFWSILVVALIVLGSWYALSAARQGGSKGESPEAIVKRRYASGEIDRGTYERMLADLR